MSKPNTAGNKHAYEVAVLIDANLDDKKANALVEKYLEIVTADGGTIEKTDFWGRRKLAYQIDKKSEAIYIIVNFTAESKTTDEFARRLGLDENVIRFKTFRGDF